MKKFAFFVCLLLLPVISFAWNATGHQLIAQIAYWHLKPAVKMQVNQLIAVLNDDYPKANFVRASVWADQIKNDNIQAYNQWHYINNYFSDDNSPLPKASGTNAVWAVNQAIKVLQSPQSKLLEKAFFLRFLIHIVGDLHQPLHAASRVSKEYPLGDQGGNLYPIDYPPYNNLHGLWDNGVGFFREGYVSHRSRGKQIKRLANRIERDYPPSYFSEKAQDLNPQSWAAESFALARNSAYQTPQNEKPKTAYLQRGQQISEQQIALAAYRLAHLLNRNCSPGKCY